MARKSKRQIEEEEAFEKHKSTIYQAAKDKDWAVDFEEDRLFAVLCVCGYPAAEAYRIAYPNSRASVSSSAVLASRRLREPGVQSLIACIIRDFENGYLTINTTCNKGKGRRSRRPRWMPPAKKSFDPFD